ncbi:MAG: ferrous iron transport protein A [Chloroflexus sp.]
MRLRYGATIVLSRVVPFSDPLAVTVKRYRLSPHEAEARLIHVEPIV